ncbi:hypothetical protein PCIT_a1291 [Pseudoalteromonas citrea]|uniref:Uncharacterized protein n=1 Tax=Pseudoalteromonas citrea TaxID=43655 RepID=A0AAD4FTN1_9GAMM|nr:hypothetical protein PCIT_a1291 [Pseudoalteromonas citrea]
MKSERVAIKMLIRPNPRSEVLIRVMTSITAIIIIDVPILYR